MKISISKEKFTCPQTPDFLTLRSNIFAKTKNFVKPFLPVHIGLRSNLFSKKRCQKSRDTVPLIAPCEYFFHKGSQEIFVETGLKQIVLGNEKSNAQFFLVSLSLYTVLYPVDDTDLCLH